MILVAGLLVGFGSWLGNGCTSGHGVCGLARLSPRSLAATLTFMTVGVAVVFVPVMCSETRRMRLLAALDAGLLFGAGLSLSRMIDGGLVAPG